MGLSKPIIIASESVDVSNLATKSDLSTLSNSLSNDMSSLSTTITNSVGGMKIKSFQKGSAATTATSITISSVTTNNAIAFCTSGTYGHRSDSTAYVNTNIGVAVFLTSATKLLVDHGQDTSSRYFDWCVIEFE